MTWHEILEAERDRQQAEWIALKREDFRLRYRINKTRTHLAHLNGMLVFLGQEAIEIEDGTALLSQERNA